MLDLTTAMGFTYSESKWSIFVDAGFSYNLLFKKKGTLTLSISDVFNSRKRRGTLFTNNLYRRDEFQWRGRTARLTLNYRLNQKKRRGGGRRGGGGYEGGGQEF